MKKVVKLHSKLSNLWLKVGKSSIPLKPNAAYSSIHKDELCDAPTTKQGETPANTCHGNKIMVVIDSSKQAKDALHWALFHAAQKEDTLILIHIAKPTNKGCERENEINSKAYALLSNMKSICETKKPGVKVELEVVKGKEKGRTIVEEAKLKKTTLLVLGHSRRSVMWRLVKRWRRKKKNSSNEVADYCIENASCMTIAVRRKSRKLGGYLITTKRHKNFWLLA